MGVFHNTSHNHNSSMMMMKLAATLLLLSSLVSCDQAEQPKDLLCDICVDIVTDLDEWITSDSTMDDIINFVEGLCRALGAIASELEQLCDTLVESNLPEIINGLVEDNLSPTEVCANIGACYKPPPTTAAP